MSFHMQQGGWAFLAGILANSGRKIDGMYAEWSTSDLHAGERTHSRYENMPEGSGYIRLPVTTVHASDNGTIHFTSYMDTSNLPKDIGRDACIRCATLVSMGRTPQEDTLLFTVDLTSPVKLVDNTYIVIHAGMKLGDGK